MAPQYPIPAMPRVVSPSPPPADIGDGADYSGPLTRSAAKKVPRAASVPEEDEEEEETATANGNDASRSRTRNRSPSKNGGAVKRGRKTVTHLQLKEEKADAAPAVPDKQHLSPAAIAGQYLRNLSRSPSPLGLIPIHKSFRSFIHRHEIPRKALHVSIGFFTLYLYIVGKQTDDIHPWLLGALLFIGSVDVLRHNVYSFNQFYIKVLGAFMRESEVNDKYNGVIFYLLGTWIALRFFPKDVGVMSVLLLSWCDTAASTFGRLYGRYTPQIRQGKSLAGSIAAATVGVITSAVFWGYVVPKNWGFEPDFLFSGTLRVPSVVTDQLQLKAISIDGWAALGIVSVWSGLVASAAEIFTIFNLDDNLTIPVLSGLGLWAFLLVFG